MTTKRQRIRELEAANRSLERDVEHHYDRRTELEKESAATKLALGVPAIAAAILAERAANTIKIRTGADITARDELLAIATAVRRTIPQRRPGMLGIGTSAIFAEPVPDPYMQAHDLVARITPKPAKP